MESLRSILMSMTECSVNDSLFVLLLIHGDLDKNTIFTIMLITTIVYIEYMQTIIECANCVFGNHMSCLKAKGERCDCDCKPSEYTVEAILGRLPK